MREPRRSHAGATQELRWSHAGAMFGRLGGMSEPRGPKKEPKRSSVPIRTNPYRSVHRSMEKYDRSVRSVEEKKNYINFYSFFTDRWVHSIFYNGSVSGSHGSVK